ncbi:MAG TPA: helix-turn-helix domain-containing protein, partial [Sphingobacteriaceae bacterium]
QLLMIGDLHQLAPVVREDDWRILKDYYPNLYFFSSRALSQTSPVSIQLNHIYRQSDPGFIDLLNRVRENRMDEKVLEQLNQRYIENFNPGEDEGYITLTTHNHTAQEINEEKLRALKGKVNKFTAVIHEDFPEFSYPTEQELEIKIGCQVMFVKNDASRERLFYNGKIGKVIRIQDDVIYVKCPGDTREIAVEPVEWSNIKFELDPDTREVREKVIGTFTQYPLKLAWAITIHKSQGLTFEKAVIDANAAFAHGQVYVALSRCKSFEGLVLRSPLVPRSVRTDGTVAEYTRQAGDNAPGRQQLQESRFTFQKNLLTELFDFSALKTSLYYCNRGAEDHAASLIPETASQIKAVQARAETEIYAVSRTFTRQLLNLASGPALPEENELLQERIRKAADYFLDKLGTAVSASIARISLESDNKAVKETLYETVESLRKAVFLKSAALEACRTGFHTLEYLKARSNAELDYKKAPARPAEMPAPDAPPNVAHPELYRILKAWRDRLAREKGAAVYMILPQKALMEIIRVLPTNGYELGTIKGLGKVKIRQFGEEILEMVRSYCIQHDLQRTLEVFEPAPKAPKTDTKTESLTLFKQGMAIPEIAASRNLTTGTVEGHLAHFILTGEVEIFELVPRGKAEAIIKFLTENPGVSSHDARAALGEEVTYTDLKAVKNHLNFIHSE